MVKGESRCPIAIIGMACKYPGANTPRELWENILSKRRQFRRMPDCRTPLRDYYHVDPKIPDKTHLKNVAVIDGFKFDWQKRRIPYSTFKSTDIVHWLALEVAIATMTDAGYTRESIDGRRTGVIVGNTLTGEHTRSNTMRLRWPFVRRALNIAAEAEGIRKKTIDKIDTNLEKYYKSVFPSINEDSLAGGLSNTIAGRICNYLDLGGGGYTVDGACSSSLLSIATAANGLMNQDFDLAFAGGVDISLDPFEIVGFAKAGALTPDEMRVYDRRANGFLPGEGCGFVLLKRLEDARKDNDEVYAILHGWGVSSDGKGAGITAPNSEGQARAIRRAYFRSPFNLDQVDFIEGHGTGTAVGDQVEIEGIALAIDSSSISTQTLGRYCGITSLKSIIGHTKAAAGVGAFIKAAMAVNQRIVPPTAACRYPNISFKTENKSLYPILTGKTVASSETLRAGISAMGFGGINCHVCIESADQPNLKLKPTIKERVLLASNQKTELFILTGQSSSDLRSQVDSLSQIAADISIAEMADLAIDLAKRSAESKKFRAAVIASNPSQLTERFNRLSTNLREKPPNLGAWYHDTKNLTWMGNGVTATGIGLIFPGQGAQQLNMAQRLIARYDWARDILKHADQLLTRDGHEPISAIVYRNLDSELGSIQSEGWARTLARTENAQPSVCIASLLWLQWLNKIGVKPAAVGGHSLGELTAFHAAGAYDIDTLVRFSGYRGRIFADQVEKDGAMISLRCSKNQAEDLLKKTTGYATFANFNAPRQMVIAGENCAIKKIAKLANDAAIPTYRLAVTGAFHSMLVGNAASAIEKVTILPPEVAGLSCPIFNGIDGREIKSGRKLKAYFANQIQAPVNFIALIQSMSKICDLLIEVGPGQALSGMINEINKGTGPFCLPVESTPGKDIDVNQLLATLFIYGTTINWDTVYESRLTRPFINPSERLFFESPCERAFDTPVSMCSTTGTPTAETLESLFTGLGNISKEKIERYLKTRGAFLARIIQTDMEFSLPETPLAQPPQTNQPEESVVSTGGNKSISAMSKSIESILFDTIETITGFPKDTLTLEMRLLDDLNLDSIKTGDLLARVATFAGIAGEIPPLDFSNLTLEEITQNLKLVLNKKTSSLGVKKPDILQAILDQIANLMGVLPNDINEDATLIKDLKISKAQFKNILPSLSDRIKVDIHVDLDPLLKRTVRQIASILQRLYDEQNLAKPKTPKTHRPPWTREFQVSVTPQPPPKKLKNGHRREDNWQYAHALILTDYPENETVSAVAEKLNKLGARVDVETHLSAHKNKLMERTKYTHFVNILPNHTREHQSQYDLNLRDIITRLASATAIVPASQAPRRRNTVAYLQFGGGYFGIRPETAHLNQCGATALVASIHQERSDLRVRVLDFSSDLSPETVAEKTVLEISTPGSFSAVGYDANLTRRERFQRLTEPGIYKTRPFTWNKKDVILVTGGAKGITAECALGVALACGAQMALVGRSPFPDPLTNQSEGNEISNTLKKYADLNLKAQYYNCDISNRETVEILVKKIRKEMGPITCIIHGAGLNKPKITSKVSIDEAIQEVSPKVIGALNLMAALDQTPPKLFIGLTSLSGVTGMHGNGWYGFSNEALDIVLSRYEKEHPETRTLSVAYSIWKDIGMGPRMGLVNPLEQQGIAAISTEDGVERFVRLFFMDPGVHQVIVTARLSKLYTWRFEPSQVIENARFLEKPLHITPGVESAFQVHLSLENDIYLNDHQFNGTYLFPAVFGLEAMAQAATHVTGGHDFSRVRIENFRLSQPITVDPKTGTDIIIWAEVEVKITDSAMTIIKAGIYHPGMGAKSDSFSATFILGLNKKLPNLRIHLPIKPLDINPIDDLYRKTQLFLGARFQRIRKVWALESTNGAGKTLVTVRQKKLCDVTTDAFSNPKHQTMVIGDAFCRDSLLQSVAIIMPQETSLPVHIDRIDLYPNNAHNDEKSTSDFLVTSEILSKKDNEAKSIVIATDSKGNIVERIEGLRLKILSHHDDRPTVADLLNPDSRDSQLVQSSLEKCSDTFNFETPIARMAFFPGLQNISRKLRHKTVMPLIRKTTELAFSSTLEKIEEFNIIWDNTDQPSISTKNETGLNVSLSYDDHLCLTTVGKSVQCCKIQKIKFRAREEWINLVGERHGILLKSLTDGEDSLDRAGTRIYSALELARKAYRDTPKIFHIALQKDDAVLIQNENEKILILSFPLLFTHGREHMLSFLINKKENIDYSIEKVKYDAYKEIFRTPTFGFNDNGPQGQDYFIQRVPVAFEHCAQLSRKVFFSNYICWLGDARDYAAWPVLKKVGQEFSKGKAGLVTNKTKLKILGEATVHDQIEIHLWISGSGGPANSSWEISCDFLKMMGGGEFERLAWCEQTTTWVEILDHGNVKPSPFPDFYWDVMKEMRPKIDAPNVPIPLTEPLIDLIKTEKDEIQYQAISAPRIHPILYEQIIETSLENSNLVGNIYFANYYAWQGMVRDQYFYSLIPEYFRGTGEKGELICLECCVDHLREAMPFDRIIVTMALKTLKTCSAIFHFDYYRLGPNGKRVKLAYGHHEAIWVTRNKIGEPTPTPFPKPVVEAFRQKII